MMLKATDQFQLMKLLRNFIFLKLERVYTYKSYVFVSKRHILGFVRYSFWKVILIMISIDRPKRPWNLLSLIANWLFCFEDQFALRILFKRRSRVRAVVTRGSTGLVGQNTSCKVHKVCVSLWLTWEQERSRYFKLAGQERWRRLGGRFAWTVLWYNFVLTSEHIEKKLYTDID